MKLRAECPKTSQDWEQLQSYLPSVDQAIRDAELKWGIGRLENLVTPDTLLRWKRGYAEWREAIVIGNLDKVRDWAPKIIGAIRYMQAEAERLEHKPLEPHVWEGLDAEGRVWVFTQTQAEANAVAPDNREKIVMSKDEVIRILSVERNRQLLAIKQIFPGSKVERLTARDESFAGDFAKEPYLLDVLHGEKGWDVT